MNQVEFVRFGALAVGRPGVGWLYEQLVWDYLSGATRVDRDYTDLVGVTAKTLREYYEVLVGWGLLERCGDTRSRRVVLRLGPSLDFCEAVVEALYGAEELERVRLGGYAAGISVVEGTVSHPVVNYAAQSIIGLYGRRGYAERLFPEVTLLTGTGSVGSDGRMDFGIFGEKYNAEGGSGLGGLDLGNRSVPIKCYKDIVIIDTQRVSMGTHTNSYNTSRVSKDTHTNHTNTYNINTIITTRTITQVEPEAIRCSITQVGAGAEGPNGGLATQSGEEAGEVSAPKTSVFDHLAVFVVPPEAVVAAVPRTTKRQRVAKGRKRVLPESSFGFMYWSVADAEVVDTAWFGQVQAVVASWNEVYQTGERLYPKVYARVRSLLVEEGFSLEQLQRAFRQAWFDSWWKEHGTLNGLAGNPNTIRKLLKQSYADRLARHQELRPKDATKVEGILF